MRYTLKKVYFLSTWNLRIILVKQWYVADYECFSFTIQRSSKRITSGILVEYPFFVLCNITRVYWNFKRISISLKTFGIAVIMTILPACYLTTQIPSLSISYNKYRLVGLLRGSGYLSIDLFLQKQLRHRSSTVLWNHQIWVLNGSWK